MTAPLITSHVWRPPVGAQLAQQTPIRERPCDYMNCGRPRDEHAHASRRHERVAVDLSDQETDPERAHTEALFEEIYREWPDQGGTP